MSNHCTNCRYGYAPIASEPCRICDTKHSEWKPMRDEKYTALLDVVMAAAECRRVQDAWGRLQHISVESLENKVRCERELDAALARCREAKLLEEDGKHV